MDGLLFIDDEEGVRRSVTRALKREPYPVFTVENGRQGVSVVEEDPARFGTVISDFKMPFMDGLETLTRIGAMNPEITPTGGGLASIRKDATNRKINKLGVYTIERQELKKSISVTIWHK